MTEKDWPTVPVIGHWIIWVYRGVHGPIKGLQDTRVVSPKQVKITDSWYDVYLLDSGPTDSLVFCKPEETRLLCSVCL